MTTATRQRPPSTRSSSPSNPKPTTRQLRLVGIIGGLIAVAVIVAVIIALASGGDESTAATNEIARIPSGDLRQVSFADTDGQALPDFDASQAVDPAIGATAPVITASFFDGEETTIDPADGTPRILLFLAHWCPHCQDEVSSLTEWFDTNGRTTGVSVVAISTSVDQGAPNYPPSAWFLRERWPVPVLRDSAQNDLATGYGLTSFPFVVVVGGDGAIISRSGGSMTTTQWESMLASAATR